MNKEYARLFDRVKAATIDGIIIIVMMYAISEIFALFETVHNTFRIVAIVFIFLLYEPIFVSVYGGSIGHSFSGLGVRKDNQNDEKISFLIALIRFAAKTLLGWISLLTVSANPKQQAIHDLIGQSVVIYVKEE